MNKYLGFGRLTADPESRSASGNSFTTFTLAVNEKVNKQDVTLFVNCAAFGKVADVISRYCKKGNALIVEGPIRVRKDNNGNERWGVSVDRITFAGGNQGGGNKKQNNSRSQNQNQDDGGNDQYPAGDIPF
jgi:single-strand DNA-binding protein